MSYTFDGVDDDIISTAGVVVTTGNLATYFAAARPSGPGEGNFGYLISSPPGTESNVRFALRMDNQNVADSFGLFVTRTTSPYSVRGPAGLLTGKYGQWHSFAATLNSAAGGYVSQLYFDGAPVTTTQLTAGSGTQRPDASQWLAGNNNIGGGNRTFAGDHGVIAGWNRMLDPSEIALVHHVGVRAVLRGLVVHWEFMRQAGVDASGNGRTFTVDGALFNAEVPLYG
jgi:Concanavalin A-like lectin/glucanases superfamily